MSINPQPTNLSVLGPRYIAVEMQNDVQESFRKIESIFDRTDMYDPSDIFSMLKKESEVKLRLQEFQIDLRDMLYEPGHRNDDLSSMYWYNSPEIKNILSSVNSIYEQFKRLGLYVNGNLRYEYHAMHSKWLIFNNNGHGYN